MTQLFSLSHMTLDYAILDNFRTEFFVYCSFELEHA